MILQIFWIVVICTLIEYSVLWALSHKNNIWYLHHFLYTSYRPVAVDSRVDDNFSSHKYLGQYSCVTVTRCLQIACYMKEHWNYTELDTNCSTETILIEFMANDYITHSLMQ
jgi:hypothetical protein